MHIFYVWFTWSMHVEIMIVHASHRFNKQTVNMTNVCLSRSKLIKKYIYNVNLYCTSLKIKSLKNKAIKNAGYCGDSNN